jgi:hypothetical protein
MSARRIGDLLMEFDTKRPGPAAASKERVVPFQPRGQAAAAPPADVAAKVEEAYLRGSKEGRAAAMAEFETKLKEYVVASGKRSAEERERWVAEQASVIAEQIKTSWEQFESSLTGTLARLLEPFLSEAIRQQALSEFTVHLEAVAKDPSSPVLRVSGAPDLLDAVKARVGRGAVAIEYVTDSNCEVRLTSNQLIMDTQMRAWTSRLRQALPQVHHG